MAINNEVKNIRSQCQVVVYPWRSEGLSEAGTSTGSLSDAGRLDISSRLINVNFSKNLGNPAGSFSFSLANNTGLADPDWKNVLRVGTWCIIYMSQDGDLDIMDKVAPPKTRPPRNRIRGICYIERVSARTAVNEKGAFDVSYEVSGRDFGIIYSSTTIWHDLFQFESALLEAASGQFPVIGDKPLNELMQTVHDLFYSPQRLLPSLGDNSNSLTSIARQWLLPRSMVRDAGIGLSRGAPSFWGNLRGTTDFRKSAMNVPVSNPIDFLSGNAWSKLQQISIPAFHELFCETTLSGRPQLNFRPIPWRINSRRYPSIRKFIRPFASNPRSLVNAVDVLGLDLGEDSQNRKNHFLTTIKTALFSVEDNISILAGTRFPNENRDSVRRHGFQPMHTDINSLTLNSALGDGKANKSLLIDFSEVLYDYWNNAIFFESGNLEKIGSNDIKIGRCLQFGATVPYAASKLFYIEGYSDTFYVTEMGVGEWVQSLQLTRGVDLVDLRGRGSVARRNVSFDQEGEFTGFES